MYSVLLPRIMLMGRWGARPVRNAIAVAATVAVIGGGAVWGPGIINPGGGAPAGTANLWVDANGGTCTRQSTAGAYVDAQACSSWSTAYAAAFPGDTVTTTGTLTALQTIPSSTTNGKPGTNPVTFRFADNAKISKAVCDCINVNGRSYIVVDGGTNGLLESTANGTGLANQSSSIAIDAEPCNNCEFKNLTISNIYIHTGSNTEVDQTQSNAIKFKGDNVLVHDNVIHDVGWALFADPSSGDDGIRIHHNDVYNTDHAIAVSPGALADIYIYNNHLHDYSAWDNASNSWHHDGIHCFSVGSNETNHIGNFYIYNNRFDGVAGTNITAEVFIEGNSDGCMDPTSNLWFFNNYGNMSTSGNNGVFGIYSGRAHLYNNTQIGLTTSSGNVCDWSSEPGAAFVNNVCTTGNQIAGYDNPGGSGWESGSPDYNLFANGGGNSFVCADGSGIHFWNFSQYSLFKTCVGGESHSSAVSSANLSSGGVPQSGSAALNAGTNLTSKCSGELAALCSDINGNPRPATGSWDIGAFQVSGG